MYEIAYPLLSVSCVALEVGVINCKPMMEIYVQKAKYKRFWIKID